MFVCFYCFLRLTVLFISSFSIAIPRGGTRRQNDVITTLFSCFDVHTTFMLYKIITLEMEKQIS